MGGISDGGIEDATMEQRSPAVPALDLLLDHGPPVDGHLVLVEGVDGLPHEVAQLPLPLQEAGAPDVGLEGGLVDAGLPIFVDDLGEVDFLGGGGVFVEPFYAVYCYFSFVLLYQLVLYLGLSDEFALDEGFVLDVPPYLLGSRRLLPLGRGRPHHQLLGEEGGLWLGLGCGFGELGEEVGGDVTFLFLEGLLLLLLDLGDLLRLPVLQFLVLLGGLGADVLEGEFADDLLGLRWLLRFFVFLLAHLQQIIEHSNQHYFYDPHMKILFLSTPCTQSSPSRPPRPSPSPSSPLGFEIAYVVLQIQMLSTEVKNLHQAISGQLLPKSNELHNHVRQFLNEQIKDFQAVNGKNDQVLDELRQEWDFYNKKVSDVKAKKTKDTKFIEGGAGYLKVKDDEIKAKNKVLQSITTGLKESVTKVDPKKLAKLPYQTEPILKEVFSTFYHILYNEPAQSFNWETFVKLALLHEEGEDFITRLANINFKDLLPEYYDDLRVLKADLKFIDVCENSPFAIDIVDLADWIDYVVEGHKIFLEKRQNEIDYDKIRKDISKRSDGSTQLSEEFYNDTLRDVDAYQNNLMNLQSELRTLIIGMGQNVKGLGEIEERRGEKIAEINKI